MLTCCDLHTCVRTQKGRTHPRARRCTRTHTHARAHTHTHRRDREQRDGHARACTVECWHTVTHTHRRAHTQSLRELKSAHIPHSYVPWLFFHQRCIPQMMYLRHLAALAIFMGTETTSVGGREKEREREKEPWLAEMAERLREGKTRKARGKGPLIRGT